MKMLSALPYLWKSPRAQKRSSRDLSLTSVVRSAVGSLHFRNTSTLKAN